MFDINLAAWVLQFVKVADDVLNVNAFDLRHGVYSKNLADGSNPHKVGVGKSHGWRKSAQITKITQSSRWPCWNPNAAPATGNAGMVRWAVLNSSNTLAT